MLAAVIMAQKYWPPAEKHLAIFFGYRPPTLALTD